MKFTMDDFDNYSPDQVGYFSLKNDGDSCKCRILYETVNDFDGRCVHKVKTQSGQYKFVDCLRSYGDPQDACPLCASKTLDDRKLQSSLWLPIFRYSVTTKSVYDSGEPVSDTKELNDIVLWQRGKAFWQKQLYPLMVEKGKPFCSNIFTIIRHGKAGDIDTKYELVWEDADDTTLDDYDDIPNSDAVVLSKTFDELSKFVETRSFEEDSDNTNDFDRHTRNSVAGANESGVSRRRTRPNTDIPL